MVVEALALLFASLGTFLHGPLAQTVQTADGPTIALTEGAVLGINADIDGRTVESYYRMPFAAPPLGTLRFQAPQPPAVWIGILDGTAPSKICPQISDLDNIDLSPRDEDCLYINVHTPANRTKLLPVLFWIHGGGYRTGQGALYDGRRLAARDVIVVTFNHRLDVLGFLSTEDDVMPGNYGMMDQVAALKWVRDNIEVFGGNPDQVTIAGQSAGAASVSLLLVSPLTEGLFHGAIMESGVSLGPGAYAQPARSLSHSVTTKLIGAQVGCESPDSTELLRCFQKADIDLMLNVSRHLRLLVAGWSAPVLMSPRVEQTYGFLPDIPLNLWLDGKFHHVNTIRGFSEHEIAYFLNFTERAHTSTAETFKNTAVRGMLNQFTLIDRDHIIDNITNAYLQNVDDSSLGYAQKEVEFGSDYIFVSATLNEIEMASRASTGEKHYLYMNSVRPSYSQQPDWVTAVHADDIAYVFGLGMEVADTRSRSSMEDFMTIWTNFIKTGDPNGANGTVASGVSWVPFEESQQNMAHITGEGVSMQLYDKQWATRAYFQLLQRTDSARQG